MLRHQMSSAEILAKLAGTAEPEPEASIQNIAPARPSKIHRVSAHSSIGILDSLPAELLLIVFDLLDFRSLSRMSRVSLRGKSIIEGLPAYKDMMTHAPKVLNALGLKRVLHYYPASLLRQMLRSSECVSCAKFAVFLFLPTCERVCSECLRRGEAFRMTTVHDVDTYYGLTERQLREIPIIYTIPKVYYWLPTPRRIRTTSVKNVYLDQPSPLVNIRQLKQLVAEVFLTTENLAKLLQKSRAGRDSPGELRFYNRAHTGGCRDLPGRIVSVLHSDDKYRGMAAIRFPHVTEAGADYGCTCRGCEVTIRHDRQGLIPAAEVLRIVPRRINWSRHNRLEGIEKRLRSREEFLQHIKHCYGVPHLLVKEGILNKDSLTMLKTS